MDAATGWIYALLLLAISFGTRGSFLVLFARAELPAQLQRALRFVPAAVFPALVAPPILLPAGSLDLAPSNPQLAAGLAAVAVAARWRNTLAIIIAGMLVLHAWPHFLAVIL